MNHTGWQCPKCMKVYAPSQLECSFCNEDKNTLKQESQEVALVNLDEVVPPRDSHPPILS